MPTYHGAVDYVSDQDYQHAIATVYHIPNVWRMLTPQDRITFLQHTRHSMQAAYRYQLARDFDTAHVSRALTAIATIALYEGLKL